MCVGLALIKAGFFSYAFTDGIFPYAAHDELMVSGPTIVSYIAMSIALLTISLFAGSYGELRRHPSVAVASTLVVFAGSILGAFSERPFELDTLSCLSAVCVGSASSFMYIIWGEMMSDLSYDKIKEQVSLTLIVTFALYLVALLSPRVVSAALVVLFPLMSGIVMVYLMRVNPDSDPGKTADSGTSPITSVVQISPPWYKWLILFGLPHFVLSVANTALWATENAVSVPDDSFFLFVSFGFGALFAVVLLSVALNREIRVQVSALGRYAVPMLTVAAVAVFLGRESQLSVFGFMLVCATIVFADFLNWTLFCELAHENPKNRSRIIGWGRLFIHSGMLAGCVVGRELVGAMQTPASDSAWTLMLCGVVVSMTLLSVLINAIEEHRTNIIMRSLSKAEPFRATLGHAHQGLFSEKFGLTPREFEVLVFLCDGLGVGQIQEQLFISQNTVNTHIKRLYKKLGVHSRMELAKVVGNTVSSAGVDKEPAGAISPRPPV